MECNVGKIERIIRFIFGLFFIWVGSLFSPWWYILSAILLLTAFAGFCPLSRLFGINTCKKDDSEEQAANEKKDMDSEKDNFNAESDSAATSDKGPQIESWQSPDKK